MPADAAPAAEPPGRAEPGPVSPVRPGLGSTLVALTMLAPVLAGALMIVGPIAYGMALVWPVWGGVVPFAVWWAAAPLFLVPATQRLIATTWYGCRDATGDEATRLDAPWRAVLARAGIPAGRYRLMVVDSEELNAYATTGRIVVVTSQAARTLPPDQLEAVLAHELGHQLSLHVVPVFCHAQLMVPIRVLWWLLARSWRPVRRMWAVAVKWHTPFGFLVTFLLAILAAAAFVVSAAPAAIAFVGVALSRISTDSTEYQADRAAIDLGLGPALLAVLESFIDAGRGGTGRLGRLLAVQPLLVRRAHRIRKTLAQRSHVRS